MDKEQVWIESSEQYRKYNAMTFGLCLSWYSNDRKNLGIHLIYIAENILTV
jgi:hypothetical protein